jgi:hypothetical protein
MGNKQKRLPEGAVFFVFAPITIEAFMVCAAIVRAVIL